MPCPPGGWASLVCVSVIWFCAFLPDGLFLFLETCFLFCWGRLLARKADTVLSAVPYVCHWFYSETLLLGLKLEWAGNGCTLHISCVSMALLCVDTGVHVCMFVYLSTSLHSCLCDLNTAFWRAVSFSFFTLNVSEARSGYFQLQSSKKFSSNVGLPVESGRFGCFSWRRILMCHRLDKSSVLLGR